MPYPVVNFQPTSSFMGLQPIGIASSTQSHVLGTVVRARDVVYGEGEFLYLAGVLNTAAGDVVSYDSKTGVTARATTASIGAIGIAMAAIGPGQFGWYQVSGSGPVNAAPTAANTQAFLTATAGQVDDTGATVVAGLAFTAATVAGFATAQLERPAVSVGGATVAVGGGNTISSDPTSSGTVFVSGVANSSTNVGFTFNTTNALAGSTKLFSVKNAGVEKLSINYLGGMSLGGGIDIAGNTVFAANLYTLGTGSIFGNAGDGASGIGLRIGAGNPFVTAGAKLVSFCHSMFSGTNVEKTFIDKDGNVEATTIGAGFILKSPDGTRYRITVANGGALSAVAA